MKKTIAVLFHEKTKSHHPREYVIARLAEIWRDDGHEVIFLFGTKKFTPADICIVHVDLSVVPESYLSFAGRYPIALNGRIRDIRKSRFSKNIVRKKEPYPDSVIVKFNLNSGGGPERVYNRTLFTRFLSKFGKFFSSPECYRIYKHPQDVPLRYFGHPDYVVEKFLPEKEGGLYFIRTLHVLGNDIQCLRLASKDPIVKGESCIRIETIEPHPEILRLRKEMNLDYGKLDYCIHGGEVVLFDVNKTTGFGHIPYIEELNAMHRRRARGLYTYFK